MIFSIYGFFGAFTLVVLDHYRRLFRKEIIGKVLTSANLFNFGGVFYSMDNRSIIRLFYRK